MTATFLIGKDMVYILLVGVDRILAMVIARDPVLRSFMEEGLRLMNLTSMTSLKSHGPLLLDVQNLRPGQTVHCG